MTMAGDVLKYHLRGPSGDEDELGFILKSWLRALGDTRPTLEKQAGFYDGHKHVIASLLGRSRVIVACDATKPSDIAGFAVGEPQGEHGHPVIHWVYVRERYRRRGIARSLLDELRKGAGPLLTVTAITRPWQRRMAEQFQWRVAEHAPFYLTISDMRKAG